MPDPTYAIVPVELDGDMQTRLTELARAHIPGNDDHVREEFALFAVHAWRALWRASPSQGRVTQAMLERAANGYALEDDGVSLDNVSDEWRANYLRCMRAAFEAVGLAVEDAP